MKLKLFLFSLILFALICGCYPQDGPIKAEKPPLEDQISAGENTTADSGQERSAGPKAAVNGKLKVHYLNVGQADSILIQTPAGKNILIDGGNSSDGDAVVRYLESQGVQRLDAVVATHPHADHIGGLPRILSAFPVANIYFPNAIHTTRTYENFLRAVNASGAKRICARAGLKLELDPDVEAAILAPGGDSYEKLNNYSVVLRIEYGNTSFLFTGDAEAESENQMLAGGHLLKSDVLKVGHHGSSTSTTQSFLSAVSPKYAVISVGAGNSYGHPSQRVLASLASRGITVYRTDQSGTIVATSDGETISFDKKASPIKPHAPPAASAGTAVSKAAPAAQSAPTARETIFVTRTGKKFHREGCRYLAKSKIPISRQDVAARGYSPCSVCF